MGRDTAQREYAVYICLRQLERMQAKLEYAPYRAAIEEKWPEILEYHYDKANHSVISMIESHDKYTDFFSTIEGNEAYSYADNPIFVNPTLGDYRIRDGADFPDIQFEKIGRY